MSRPCPVLTAHRLTLFTQTLIELFTTSAVSSEADQQYLHILSSYFLDRRAMWNNSAIFPPWTGWVKGALEWFSHTLFNSKHIPDTKSPVCISLVSSPSSTVTSLTFDLCWNASAVGVTFFQVLQCQMQRQRYRQRENRIYAPHMAPKMFTLFCREKSLSPHIKHVNASSFW